MTQLVNLTPHPLRIYSVDTPDRIDNLDQGLLTTLLPSGRTARIAENDLGTHEHVSHDGVLVPIELIEYSSIYGVPKPEDGVYLIVPLVTALALIAQKQGRNDLLVPYEQVRNMEGAVVGCRLLAHPC